MIHVAVLGYGTVGSGVVEVIENNNEDFRGRLTQSNKEVLLPYSRENVFSFINGLIE